ncbi:hypothetical protein DS739_10905 [Acetobacter sp. JWB]|nr:hypothetical protein CPF11_09505 [Acetobacter pomorum]AXC27202.1 hypothetical protein DS739_10905 [Acetobacter sp. JWB]
MDIAQKCDHVFPNPLALCGILNKHLKSYQTFNFILILLIMHSSAIKKNWDKLSIFKYKKIFYII